MKQKLIFLDIDGTLLPPGEMTVPASAVEAIRQARANGHKVFLCTGRNLRMTKPLLAYGFDGFVCSAGGYVGCDGKILVDLPMEPAQVEGLREVLGRAGAECTLEARDDTYGGIRMIERFAHLFPRKPGQLNSEAERWRKTMEYGMTIRPIEEYHGEPRQPSSTGNSSTASSTRAPASRPSVMSWGVRWPIPSALATATMTCR